MNPREVFKKALNDDELKLDDKGVHPQNYATITKLIEGLPSTAYISEWEYRGANTRFKCHTHIGETGAQLYQLYEEGHRAGMPWLHRVYTRDELADLARKELVA